MCVCLCVCVCVCVCHGGGTVSTGEEGGGERHSEVSLPHSGSHKFSGSALGT